MRPDGRPANRTIVFRDYLPDTNQLQFAVDRRSLKIEQIAHQPWGELCWYFSDTREQFRLLGQLTLVQEGQDDPLLDKARQVLWQKLSDAGRVQFSWPEPREPRAENEAFHPPAPDPNMPLPQFCLLLLDPVEVDHLELRGDPQNRWWYGRSQDDPTQEIWSVQAINP
jgi:PPOX class probable FMN-dependent enzyme